MYRLTILSILCFLCSCHSISWHVPKDEQWKIEPHQSQSENKLKKFSDIEDTGHYLFVATSSKGFVFKSAIEFIETLHHHPNGDKNDNSVGHAWIVLESPQEIIECGHTGEFGLLKDLYYHGVSRKIAQQDKNPISYLKESMPDGEYHDGNSGHSPTLVTKFKISRNQHNKIYQYVNNYDYKTFNLHSKQCTDFVAGTLKYIDVYPVSKLTMHTPSKIYYWGHKIPLWTDPDASAIVLGFPDLLEESMKKLIDTGYAENAMYWYYNE